MKRRIRLTESDLHRIVMESVKSVLREEDDDAPQIQEPQRILLHNNMEEIKKIFKYIYKYAYSLNKRYKIKFRRNKQHWDKFLGGGIIFDLYFDDGQYSKTDGCITIKEINYDDFRDNEWIHHDVKNDSNDKIIMGVRTSGLQSYIVIFDKEQLYEYLEKGIRDLDNYLRRFTSYKDDNGYYSIFNDNILNSLANGIH